jgi:uncharacterized cupredoxin-like copper-binding protein
MMFRAPCDGAGLLRRSLSLALGAMILAACGATPPALPEPPPTPDMSRAVRVPVEMFEMGYAPAELRVPVGRPVIFEISNIGLVEHEFYVGSEEAQQHHAEEMVSGEEPHHEGEAILLGPGESGELIFNFRAPGSTLVGCHVPGHYEAGMKATIVIESGD